MVRMPEQLPEQKVVVWLVILHKMFEITPPVFLVVFAVTCIYDK